MSMLESGPLASQPPLQVMSPNEPGEPSSMQMYDGVSRPVPNAMEIDGGSHLTPRFWFVTGRFAKHQQCT